MSMEVALRFDTEGWQRALDIAKSLGKEAEDLLSLSRNVYINPSAYQDLWDRFGAPLAREGSNFTKVEQFYTPALSKIVTSLTDDQFEKKIPAILGMFAEGRYSISLLCRSFHTKRLAVFLPYMIRLVAASLRMYYYRNDLFDIFAYETNLFTAYFPTEFFLALGIREGDENLISGVREAIHGNNAKTRLTRQMIQGIIRSGDPELVGELLKLLGAAGLQEGLRQHILEAADCGSVQTFLRILSYCVESDLFRFSSAVRALGVWTGFSIEHSRPESAKRLGQVALEVLSDESKREEYLASQDLADVWMALWGYGCYDVDDTFEILNRYITGEDRDRKLLAWYFANNSDDGAFKMRTACAHLDERDPEVLAWLTGCLAESYEYRYISLEDKSKGAIVNDLLPDSFAERKDLFDRIALLLPVIGVKKTAFEGKPFHFSSVTLSADPVIGCLMSLAGYGMDPELVGRIPSLVSYMEPDRRQVLIASFLHPKKNQEDRKTLFSLMEDRSLAVRNRAVRMMKKLDLTDAELDTVADSMKSRSSAFRAAAAEVLRAQPEEKLCPLLHRMLSSAEEYRIKAAVELIAAMETEKPGSAEAYRQDLLKLSDRTFSTQTEILLQKVHSEGQTEEYSRENGFGLYDPSKVQAYLDSLKDHSEPAPQFKQVLGSFLPTKAACKSLVMDLTAVFTRHADYEYEVETWSGAKEKVLFGDCSTYLPVGCGAKGLSSPEARLDMLPFADDFRAALGSYLTDPKKAAGLYCVTQPCSFSSNYTYEPWFKELFPEFSIPYYGESLMRELRAEMYVMTKIFVLALRECDPHAVFETAFGAYRSIAERIGENNLARTFRKSKNEVIFAGMYRERNLPVDWHDLSILRQLIGELPLGDEDFTRWFNYEYRLEMLSGVDPQNGLTEEHIFRALSGGILPQEALFARLLRQETFVPRTISILTDKRSHGNYDQLFQQYPEAKEIGRIVADRIADVEEKRGELPTELTSQALAVGKLQGSRHFVNLLGALGHEDFHRGYSFEYATDKRAVLSSLLKCCRPTEEDTPESLGERIRETDITENRLVEAVMYCPQWAGLAEKLLGWNGLKSAVWFFHAHINEDFSAEKETEVALYSPIQPQHFVDGAFDRNWFFEVYDALGEKRFMTLYRVAKYITSGSSNHKRSQLYSDAVLGKLEIRTLEKEISDKRNQERLRCYPLIPIQQGDSGEALRRYEFIQQFAKEAKQFGAQRRESELKAVGIALENLAITTGLMDVNRLTWQMETQKTEELKPLLTPHPVRDCTGFLSIDEDGEASVTLIKDGKDLKTTPKNLAKDQSFLELKQSVKDLKEQKRRSKESLEKAMTEQTQFESRELTVLLSNPVLSPMIRKLVWTSDRQIGFIDLLDGKLKLTGPDGTEMSSGGMLRLAHPHDLITAGVWQDYMRYLYDRSIVQPFKQVFREYYPLTADESAERTVSRRYAGYQVNSKKTAALLKSRGWTADYEEGLQRVFYRENFVVRLFALADWFSPADVEAPTLEKVQFFDRKTDETVPLEVIPPILFSEVMRDIDLVVSVAYVGGVDPETSQSAVEIRTALAGELTRLLKLDNVRFIGSHAKIDGKLAKWSVHMGSGIVHAEGKGMIPITPVHSQARGRVFLPFADDDPKTAEILSKIIFLAEDTKIKDPEILSRI